jgi:hypothetical protein
MNRVKLIFIAFIILATTVNASIKKDLQSYWFKCSDDSYLGTATNHYSTVTVMCAYLEQTISGLDFCSSGGLVYANGFVMDDTNGNPQEFIYATPDTENK